MVVLSDLCGVQSSGVTGLCSQTGQDAGRLDWPEVKLALTTRFVVRLCLQFSQMACSQQGKRNALTASLLQIAQRSLIGMSS